VANAQTLSYDGLVDLLELIEQFLNRLNIYTRIPSTPEMNELVVDIMAELLSTLALATKKLRQGQQSEFVAADMSSYSRQHSQASKETFRGHGR
jgi:hypothetical protein